MEKARMSIYREDKKGGDMRAKDRTIVGVTVIALVVWLLGGATTASAGLCESCNEWTNDVNENPHLWPRDAGCCFTDTYNNNCDQFPCCTVKWLMYACWVNAVEDGYVCGGWDNNTCNDGGGPGGGGGGGCHIQHGTLCPAECFSCSYFWY